MPQLSNDQIRQILPHRYPFLLVDRISDYQPGEWARGIKCVSANEMQFMGHFPGQSVFPGVLILEALAQTGAVALLSREADAGKTALLGGVKNARFRRMVTPGDTLELECRIVRRRGGVGLCAAEARVGGEAVCSAEFTFALTGIE